MSNPVAWFEIVGSDGDMDYGLVAAEAPGIAGGIGHSQDGGPGT